MTPELSARIKEVAARASCLFTKEEIDAALDKMAAEIKAEVGESSPVFVCVLLGGIIPMGNLLTRLDFHLEVDYAHATRYTGKTHGTELMWRAKPRSDLRGRTVVIVDDILDGGITLAAVRDYCLGQGAKKVYTAVLVDKEKAREDGGVQHADFKGLTVGDKFVFGYGLDYEEYLRNVPGIYVVAPEHQ